MDIDKLIDSFVEAFTAYGFTVVVISMAILIIKHCGM